MTDAFDGTSLHRALPPYRPDEAYLRTLSRWCRTPGHGFWQTLGRVSLVAVPLAVVIAAGVLIAIISGQYPADPSARYTLIGVVLGAGLLLIVAWELPAGVARLLAIGPWGAVVGQPASAAVVEPVPGAAAGVDRPTGPTAVELELLRHIEAGALIGLGEGAAAGVDYDGWVRGVTLFVRTHGGRAEEYLFVLAGESAEHHNGLETRLTYLRDDILPKVRAGYWSGNGRS